MTEKIRRSPFVEILIGLISFLLALPLFIILHKRLPDYQIPYEADRILLFIAIVVILLLILRLFRLLIVVAFAVMLAWLSFGSFTGRYGFNNVYKDYRAIVYSIDNDPNPEHIIFSGRENFSNRSKIISAIDYENPIVRDFAVNAVNRYFKDQQRQNAEYRNTIQCFAVFKRINNNWNYVNDPASREYFATAPESAKLLAGDCDDHSILMAAALKSIGGKPRLIHTTGHIYPELFVGNKNDLERLNFLIKKELFPKESAGQDIFYHEDESGNIWLNLDYTAEYPGGPFMNEKVLDIIYP